MNPDIWTEVDDYFGELLHEASPAHDAALQASEEAQLPEIQVSAALGKFLYLLAKMRGAKRILELGTLGGYSTIWLGNALPADGFLLSLEFEPAHAKVAEANLKNANLADQTEIRIGPAIDTLNSLIEEKCEPFDFVFLDADKENYPAYLPKILDLSHSGTVLVADNVVRGGEVTNAQSSDTKVIGVRNFNEVLANEPRIDATAIQTVGSKGYDGFVIGIVK